MSDDEEIKQQVDKLKQELNSKAKIFPIEK
jgi:hypothetical protein